ncbi:hypothetical protein NKH77_28520 [Streptomyces sp. M19]
MRSGDLAAGYYGDPRPPRVPGGTAGCTPATPGSCTVANSTSPAASRTSSPWTATTTCRAPSSGRRSAWRVRPSTAVALGTRFRDSDAVRVVVEARTYPPAEGLAERVAARVRECCRVPVRDVVIAREGPCRGPPRARSGAAVPPPSSNPGSWSPGRRSPGRWRPDSSAARRTKARRRTETGVRGRGRAGAPRAPPR